VFAWGQGGQGQLGNGYLKNSTTPITVPGLGGLTIKSITASVYDSMVVTTSGRVYGWGFNGYSEIRGDGKVGIRSTPIQSAIGNVQAIAQGTYFTVALKTDGTVWTWGRNEHGQLGRGTINNPTWYGIPKQVPGLSGGTSVAAGREFALVLKDDGSVWAWGLGRDGELHNDQMSDSAIPVRVHLIFTDTRAITAGAYNALAITP
jgi:alpha-tubulin suppressor-like RCC1 family protein